MFSSDRAPISFPLLDGGLGWWTVIAGVISNFVSMGLYRSGGIIYMAAVKNFNASRTVAAWVPMVTMMIVFFTAPIGTFLATRFTFHWVIFLGGILGTIGMLINFLATNLETLFFGWSFLFGMGSSLAFFPSLAIVGQCFKKRRPVANGIVLAGGAIGSSCLPPLLEYLIDVYRLDGACLIVTGLVLQYFVTSILLRTIYILTRKPVKSLPAEMALVDKKDVLLQEENKAKSCFRLDLSFVNNCTFIVNGLTNGIQASLFLAMVTILPDLAVEEMGVSRFDGAYLVSATAFADLSSRLLSGVCLLRLKINKSTLYAMTLCINVLDLLMLAYVRNYPFAMFAAVIGGMCFAFGVILYFEILASCQSPELYPKAFGLSELMKTPLLLLTATSVGSLKDATGSYSTTFLIFAIAETFAVCLWIFEIAWTKRKLRTQEIGVKS